MATEDSGSLTPQYLAAYHESAKQVLSAAQHEAIHRMALPKAGGRTPRPDEEAAGSTRKLKPDANTPNLEGPSAIIGQPLGLIKADAMTPAWNPVGSDTKADPPPAGGQGRQPSMVAYFPPPDLAMKMHPGADVPDAQPPADLHMTLLDCGDLTDDEFKLLQQQVESFAKVVPQIPAKVAGVGAFLNPPDVKPSQQQGGAGLQQPPANGNDQQPLPLAKADGMDAGEADVPPDNTSHITGDSVPPGGKVVHALIDSPELPAFRQALLEHVAKAGVPVDRTHGFVPHVTLASLPPDGDLNPYSSIDTSDFNIDTLTAARGPERHMYPLQQSWPGQQDLPDQDGSSLRKGEPGGGGSAHTSDASTGAVSPTAFEVEVPILKAEDERRIVYGVVLQPGQEDSQGDRVSEAEIERAAHRFLDLYREYDVDHDGVSRSDIRVVESYLAPADMLMKADGGKQTPIRKGSWILASQVGFTPTGDQIWTRIKKGQIDPDDPEALTGYSMDGSGIRKAIAEEVLR